MRLLVSVRRALEVVPALEGGADIIDAKEPGNGSLGPVSQAVLVAIARQVPDERGLSVALGDLTTPAQVSEAIERSMPGPRTGDTFLKLGFAGLKSPASIDLLLAEAVRLAEAAPGVRLIAVAYADHLRARSAAPRDIADIAGTTGAAGILLDTFIKDGSDLLSWFSPPELDSWVAQLREKQLLAALAGSLRGHSFEAACAAHPDIVGVRGAACVGGRGGRVEVARVRALRALMQPVREAVSGKAVSSSEQ